MRLFITGGTGWLGTAVLEYLRDTANYTLILSRTRSGPDYLTGDIRTVQYPDEPFDAVLHMSLETEGTDRLLQWAKNIGAKRFLLVSSGAVYNHKTPYADAKREAEELCQASEVNATIARCFTFVGPGMPMEHYAIGNFIRDAFMGQINVKGLSVRSYLDTSELAHWLMHILLYGNGIYDVGSEFAISTPQLARLVRDVVNPSSKIITTGTEGTIYLPNTERARRELGLEQQIALSQSIRRTAEAYASIFRMQEAPK